MTCASCTTLSALLRKSEKPGINTLCGVKSSPSGQLSLHWSTVMYYTTRCIHIAAAISTQWVEDDAMRNVSPSARDFEYFGGAEWQLECPDQHLF